MYLPHDRLPDEPTLQRAPRECPQRAAGLNLDFHHRDRFPRFQRPGGNPITQDALPPSLRDALALTEWPAGDALS